MSSIVDFYISFYYASVKEVVSSPSGHITVVNSFRVSFVNNYTNNEEFRGIFLPSLCKIYAVKVDGVPNPQYGTDVLNLFLSLSASGDKKAFGFVSGNLCGFPLSQMKKIRPDCGIMVCLWPARVKYGRIPFGVF